MSQVIKITLFKSLAVNSAKNETFKTAVIDKAAEQKNVTLAYHESAGDDQYDERMLARGFFTQCEMLKTWFAEFLTGSGNSADDPLVSSEERDDAVKILLRVSDRFNLGYVKTLARLGQKYVEDRMVHLWWATSDEKKAEFYAKLAEEDLAAITKCFTKTAPKAPSYCFPDSITLTFPVLNATNSVPGGSPARPIPADTLFSTPFIMAVGDETEITYVLSKDSGEKPIDDIIVRADDGCCLPFIDDRGQWLIKGICQGVTIVTLFSRHDDRVFEQFAVRVTT